jgi:hypothetical protein
MAAKKDIRKPLSQLIAEKDQYRKLLHKTFVHNKSSDKFQLLMFAFDEHTNELQAVYNLTAMPALKFVCSAAHFLESFTVDASVSDRG